MPSAINWYIKERVIHIRIYGAVDVAEMETSSQAVVELLEAGKPLIHIIVDDREIKTIPTSLGQLRKSLPFIRHTSLGWVIATGKVSPIFNFVSGLLSSVFRVRYRRFDTLVEGLDFLKAQDLTLDWSQADKSVLEKTG